MQNRLVIIGAGGHGRVVADIALKQGYRDIIFLDDNARGKSLGFEIIGPCSKTIELNDDKTDFVIGIGNNQIRKKIAKEYGVNWVTLVHPTAIIGTGVQLGKGTIVTAGAIINPGSIVGEHCIINTAAVVEHDNVLENYVHISPKVALGGSVYVGAGTHVGIGAVVRNNINICGNSVIGAGATVVKDITEEGIYVGVPARKIK